MPKYRIKNITNPVNVSEQEVEDFLQKYPDAVLIEEEQIKEVAQDTTSADLLDPTTFQTDAAADADVVSQPMTASQAEYVEPEDTELAPVDTSLESPDPEPNPFSEKYLEFSSGYDKNKKSRIYEADYAQNYAGQTWNKKGSGFLARVWNGN